MANKNSKMTEQERAVHNRAVSLRKMTDQQLCDTIDRQRSAGIDEGLKMAKDEQSKANSSDREIINRFIDYLESKIGSGNGIGGGTVIRLKKEAKAYTEEA